jgi:hypothetical protein
MQTTIQKLTATRKPELWKTQPRQITLETALLECRPAWHTKKLL